MDITNCSNCPEIKIVGAKIEKMEAIQEMRDTEAEKKKAEAQYNALEGALQMLHILLKEIEEEEKEE